MPTLTQPPPRQTVPVGNTYLELRAGLGTALFALGALAVDARAPESTLGTLQGLQGGLREPLLFVVMGEVQAGKSSLLNALFGREFCHADVLPATDRIHVFKHGEPARDVPVSPALLERYQPTAFLRDFNVVDTPGINTVAGGHAALTENFVPQADLILFVLSAVNPWANGAWAFLDLLQKKWRKNVVLVLQQTDLREAREVAAITEHLRQTAVQKLGAAVPLFAVSAKKALLAKTTGVDKDRLWAESGFGALEDFVSHTLGTAEANPRMVKLRSVAGTARLLLGEIADQTRADARVLAEDRGVLARRRETLAGSKRQSQHGVQGSLRGLEGAFARCRHWGELALEERLRWFPTLALVFSRGGGNGPAEFQHNLETRLRASVTERTAHALASLEAELQGVWTEFHGQLRSDLGAEARARLGPAPPDPAESRTRLLEKTELVMAERLADDSVERGLQSSFARVTRAVRLTVAAAVLGGVVTSLVAARAAGATLPTLSGLLFTLLILTGVMVTAGTRRKLFAAHRAQMATMQNELTNAVGDLILQTIDGFYDRLAGFLTPLEAFCDARDARLGPLTERARALERQFAKVAARL